MKKNLKKILFIFGTRPEAIKMASVVKECKKHPGKFTTRICVTAQHREMLDQVLNLFGMKPDFDLDLMTKRQSLPDLTARILLGVTEIIKRENPDAVFVQGDTTTTFSAALAAFYLQIPVAHIEAGLRTGNRHNPFPEEINRRLTSALSNFHFAPTESAKTKLLAEGVDPSSVFVTGNTVVDALLIVLREINKGGRAEKWKNWFFSQHNINLSKQMRTILVTGHRRESFGAGLKNICDSLSILAKNNPDIQIIYPVHLNPNVQEAVYATLNEIHNIHLIPPLDYEPFVYLMKHSYLILTDSGGIQEEAPTLGKPLLITRSTSERIEGIDAGSAKLVGLDTGKIIEETERLLHDDTEYARMSNTSNPYGDGLAGVRICEIIQDELGSDYGWK